MKNLLRGLLSTLICFILTIGLTVLMNSGTIGVIIGFVLIFVMMVAAFSLR